MSRKIVRFDKNKNTPAKGPAKDSGQNRFRAAGNRVAQTKRSISILFVSANAKLVEAVRRYLGDMVAYDADISAVKTLDEARATATHDHFDILLLDDRLATDAAFSFVLRLANESPSCAPILLSRGATVQRLHVRSPKPGASRSMRPRSGAITALPNSIADLLRILPRQDISADTLETIIRRALAAARRRDAAAAKPKSLGNPASDGSDGILPWMRATLGEINKIHGGATLALDRLWESDDEDPQALLRSTVKASDRLRADMLATINRLEDNHRPASSRTVDVDITRLLDQVVRDYRLDAEERGQTLNYQRPDLPLLMSANPHALRDVFRVILRNTIRNTTRDTRIDIALSIRSGEICISVCDTSPDGHWTSVVCADQPPCGESGSDLGEKAGGIILINELMRVCNGSIDVVTTAKAANEMRCFFPRSGVA